MIPGFFLNILYVALNYGVHSLPAFDIPASILSAFDLIWSYTVSFSFMTPIGAIQGALALVLLGTLFEVGIYIFFKLITAITNRKIHH